MKNKLQSWKILLGVAGFSVCLASCIKGDVKDLKDEGATVVKFLGGGGDALVKPMDADPIVETVNVLDVRRDASTKAMLNQPATVTITNTQEFLDDYNAEFGTSYELLPAAAYTITSESGVTVSGTTWTITLAAGEFARSIDVTLDKSKMDLSKQYALACQITQTSSGVVSQAAGFQVVNPLVKNKYDGVFSVESGTVTRYTSPGVPAGDALSGDVTGNPDVELATVGPNSVEISGLEWAFGSGSGVAGIDHLQATVDPATNLVTMKSLGNATLINWAGHENKYDPATKTFYLAFIWNPTANARTYEIVIKYQGPR